MPKQVSRSGSVLAKLGPDARSVHEKHRQDSPDFGQPAVPAGIEGGIAQLKRIWLGEFKEGPNKGKLFFMAMGTIFEPVAHNGTPVRGLMTQIGPEALCNTPNTLSKRKTFEDHWAWMLNQIRILDPGAADVDFDNIELALEALQETQPFFRFRTAQMPATKTNPNPKIWQQWNGVCEYTPGAEMNNGAMVDRSAVVPDISNGKEVSSEANGQETTEKEGEESQEQFSEFDDLNSLAEAADNEDDDRAVDKLTELALQAGVTKKQISTVKTWAEVVAMIESATTSEEEEGGVVQESPVEEEQESPEEETQEEESEPTPPPKPAKKVFVPKVDGVVLYSPKDKSGKILKATECEVLSVDAKVKTVSLKNLENTKLGYKNVPWASIKPAVTK